MHKIARRGHSLGGRLGELPDLVRDALRREQLNLDGQPQHGALKKRHGCLRDGGLHVLFEERAQLRLRRLLQGEVRQRVQAPDDSRVLLIRRGDNVDHGEAAALETTDRQIVNALAGELLMVGSALQTSQVAKCMAQGNKPAVAFNRRGRLLLDLLDKPRQSHGGGLDQEAASGRGVARLRGDLSLQAMHRGDFDRVAPEVRIDQLGFHIRRPTNAPLFTKQQAAGELAVGRRLQGTQWDLDEPQLVKERRLGLVFLIAFVESQTPGPFLVGQFHKAQGCDPAIEVLHNRQAAR